MHESRLVADIVDEAVRVATLNDSESVREMQVSIGALSHVTPLSLENHLREAAAGTPISRNPARFITAMFPCTKCWSVPAGTRASMSVS